ncbi:MAG: DUF1801 domain-containing protein [Eubacteriales bacterium]|nr:DUF1801 domain-containing protein [Eubacteriales bacterium]
MSRKEIGKRRDSYGGTKTKQHDGDVFEFIKTFTDTPRKREDSYELVKLMQTVTGQPPKMWGPSMIGFGSYHYKSERSKQEGDWPILAFSPRKAAISLYVYTGYPEHEHLLNNLGKYTIGKACIYIKKLSDINLEILEKLMHATINFLEDKYKPNI